VIGQEVGRTADIDDCLHLTRVLGELRVGVVASVFHPEQSCQLRSGGVPESPDVVWIDVVLAGIGPQPTNGKLHIIQLHRPVVLVSMKQPVVHRCRDKSTARQEIAHTAHGAFVETAPAAAVKQHNCRTRTRTAVGWQVKIEQQLLATRLSVGNVLLHRDCAGRHRSGRLRIWRQRRPALLGACESGQSQNQAQQETTSEHFRRLYVLGRLACAAPLCLMDPLVYPVMSAIYKKLGCAYTRIHIDVFGRSS